MADRKDPYDEAKESGLPEEIFRDYSMDGHHMETYLRACPGMRSDLRTFLERRGILVSMAVGSYEPGGGETADFYLYK